MLAHIGVGVSINKAIVRINLNVLYSASDSQMDFPYSHPFPAVATGIILSYVYGVWLWTGHGVLYCLGHRIGPGPHPCIAPINLLRRSIGLYLGLRSGKVGEMSCQSRAPAIHSQLLIICGVGVEKKRNRSCPALTTATHLHHHLQTTSGTDRPACLHIL